MPAVLALAVAVALSLSGAEAAAARSSSPEIRHWSGVLERAVRELACRGAVVASAANPPVASAWPAGRAEALRDAGRAGVGSPARVVVRGGLIDLPPPMRC